MKHEKTSWRCLVYHHDYSKGMGCIKCSCGEYIRPHNWKVHAEEEESDAKTKSS